MAGKREGMLVSAALIAGTLRWHLIPALHVGASPSSSAEPSPGAAGQPASRRPTPSTIVRLRSRPGFDTPATSVALWWITDPRFGKVSVYVPIGQTPRDALTVALAARGYQSFRRPGAGRG